MHNLDLREYQRSDAVVLTAAQRAALREAVKPLAIEPSDDGEGLYHLTPASTVGAIEVAGLSVVIKPKITMQQVLSLALYAMDVSIIRQPSQFHFKEETALPDLLALALATAARRAFSRGLLHGYRTEEEALYGVRGRIRFDEQLRRRFGRTLPVEVRYDDFTDDILENRLVKAAAGRLAAMPLRAASRRGLAWIAGTLANVTPVEYPPNAVPEVRFDRLNEHYRGVVDLARLVLRHSAFQSSRGAVRAIGFLFDMNDVFQGFLTRALREALGSNEREFREQHIRTLDEGGKVTLKPDLVWQRSGRIVFVGDAKYKRVQDDRVPNADLYQLLAYTIALDLPGGLLVYAKGEADVATHTVRHASKRLDVMALDLGGSLDDVLDRVGGKGGIAERVQALACSALSPQ